uniref:Uncharacterized protein n=1 Tax=Aegilops tauschii TaxID=37682 RepID=R7WBJ1_AEGTA
MNAAWAVHLYQPPHARGPFLLLHSAAYGRYLAATGAPAPLGHRGHRVEQRSYNHPEEEAMFWLAVRTEFGDDVLLQHFNGGSLRANGKYLPWNNGASVGYINGIHDMSTMMHWVVEPILARETMPPLPRSTGGEIRLPPEGGAGQNAVQVLGVADLVMCLPTRDGRLFPLLVDLPSNRESFHVVVVVAGTPPHAALRYADVDAE